MSERERLPNRRASETFNLEHAAMKYTVTISRFADGRVGEAFFANYKRGNRRCCSRLRHPDFALPAIRLPARNHRPRAVAQQRRQRQRRRRSRD